MNLTTQPPQSLANRVVGFPEGTRIVYLPSNRTPLAEFLALYIAAGCPYEALKDVISGLGDSPFYPEYNGDKQ